MLLWRHTLGHVAISDVKTDGATLYVLVDGSIEALRANDGAVLWRSQLPPSSLREMHNTFLETVTNGIIYVASGKGPIYALQTSNGAILWHYQASPGTEFGSFSIWGNTLYVGMLAISTPNPYRIRSSFLLALRINDGYLLWQKHLGEQEILNPAAGQGVVYVIYETGNNGQEVLSALRATDGTSLWTRTLLSLS